MSWKLYILVFSIVGFNFFSSNQHSILKKSPLTDSILKIEMNLSAFGVESDNFPSINAYVDFKNNSSKCKKTFYNPAYKDSTYLLSQNEIRKILKILLASDLGKLKKEYKVQKTDQPTSITIIITSNQKFIIKDYGLEGEYPLQELYKIVYKL